MNKDKVTRKSILETALKCVCGDREQDYGSPENNFQTIANLWVDYLNAKEEPLNIMPYDVANMMALMKIARIVTGRFKADSYVDACGYLACAAECDGGEQ